MTKTEVILAKTWHGLGCQYKRNNAKDQRNPTAHSAVKWSRTGMMRFKTIISTLVKATEEWSYISLKSSGRRPPNLEWQLPWVKKISLQSHVINQKEILVLQRILKRMYPSSCKEGLVQVQKARIFRTSASSRSPFYLIIFFQHQCSGLNCWQRNFRYGNIENSQHFLSLCSDGFGGYLAFPLTQMGASSKGLGGAWQRKYAKSRDGRYLSYTVKSWVCDDNNLSSSILFALHS